MPTWGLIWNHVCVQHNTEEEEEEEKHTSVFPPASPPAFLLFFFPPSLPFLMKETRQGVTCITVNCQSIFTVNTQRGVQTCQWYRNQSGSQCKTHITDQVIQKCYILSYYVSLNWTLASRQTTMTISTFSTFFSSICKAFNCSVTVLSDIIRRKYHRDEQMFNVQQFTVW